MRTVTIGTSPSVGVEQPLPSTVSSLKSNEKYDESSGTSIGDPDNSHSSLSQRSEHTSGYFSRGRDCYDDGCKSEDVSAEERLNFSNIKLAGREQEMQILNDVYGHASRKGVDSGKPLDLKTETSCVMIKGKSGTGKSTLVKQFVVDLNKKSLVMGGPTKPYFLSGKYDELSGGDPFSAIVEAFSGFAQSLLLDLNDQDLDAKAEVTRIRAAIQTALGSEARVMATMVPSLRDLILSKNDMTPAQTIPSDNAWNRLKYIFQVFTNAISTSKRPVVFFLDDLQWADSASLELLESLLTDKDLRYFMFIGAYRSNEVHADDELMTRICTISRVQGIKNMELTNLSMGELNDFIAHALKVKEDDKDRTTPFTEMIYAKTGGNIFFAVQLLEELHRKKVLLFSRLASQWEWNLEDANNLDGLVSDDVIAAVTSKIIGTSDLLQKALVLMAYSRSTVDIETIRLLLEMDGYSLDLDNLAKLLEKGVLDGLLTNRMGSNSYSFAHDRIRQASYELVPKGKERDEFRFKLGRRLYKIGSLDPSDKNWLLFAAADHLNATCMQLKSLEKDPLFLTKINLKAGTRAASVAAFETAAKFLGFAMGALLQRVKDPWAHEYQITLQVYEGIVIAELCQGHFEVGHGIASKVLSNAKTPEDKLPTLYSLSKALGQECRYVEAYELAQTACRELGVFSKSFIGVNYQLIKDMNYVKKYLKKHSDEEILSLPMVQDENLVSTMKMLSMFTTQAYYCKHAIKSLASSLKQLKMTFKHGLFATSANAIMSYTLFSQAMNDKAAVDRYLGLSCAILKKVKDKQVEVLQAFLSAYYIHAWKDSHDTVFSVYDRGEKAGMEAGDFENGLLCALASNHYKLLAGFPLQEIDSKYTGIMERLQQYKVASMAHIVEQQQLYVQHVMGQPPNFEELRKFGFAKGDRLENYPLIFGCITRIHLGIHFGKYRFAEKMIELARGVWEMDEAYTVTSLRLFLSAIVYSTLARESEGRKKIKKSYLKKARSCSKELKALCKLKGMKCYHRHLIAEAQIAAADGSGATVPKRYNAAITAAYKYDQIHDAALTGQLAAEYFLDMDDGSMSSSLMLEARNKLVRENLAGARDMYLKWGARSLVNHLETKYHKYLEPTVGLFDEQSTAGDSAAITFNSFGEEADYGAASVMLPKSIAGSQIVNGKRDDVSVLSGMTGATGFTGASSYNRGGERQSGTSDIRNFGNGGIPRIEEDGALSLEDTGW